MSNQSIKVKALVERETNKIILVESEEDFVDVLFSFLTMPVGTIINLTRGHQPEIEIGCLNNLYRSVKDLDSRLFRTEVHKSNLMHPPNGAAVHCLDLKVNIDCLTCFNCGNNGCFTSKNKLFSHYKGTICACGNQMNHSLKLIKGGPRNVALDPLERGVFVRGLSRLVTSDELKVLPLSATASFSFFSKLGVTDASTIEEMTFDIGVDEVLYLLKSSLISKTPLTETLLKKNKVPESSQECSDQGSSLNKYLCMTDSFLGFFFDALNSLKTSMIPNKALKEVSESSLEIFDDQMCSSKHHIGGLSSEVTVKICVRLMVSKSKRKVCFAEAGKDFVDLLFSFLALPLGWLAKEMCGTSSKGCINYLYESVEDLDVEKYFKSDYQKKILLNPKIARGYVYENKFLEVEETEAVNQYYYLEAEAVNQYCYLKHCQSIYVGVPSNGMGTPIAVEEATSSGGFVIGPALFTITDDLIITPISTISSLSVLNQLKIPFSDIEEQIVYMGKDEALRLIKASFTSESALTDTFIHKRPKEEGNSSLCS